LESSANDSDRSGNFALDFHMIPETAVSSRQEILRKHVLNRKTDFCECCYESPFFVFLQRIWCNRQIQNGCVRKLSH